MGLSSLYPILQISPTVVTFCSDSYPYPSKFSACTKSMFRSTKKRRYCLGGKYTPLSPHMHVCIRFCFVKIAVVKYEFALLVEYLFTMTTMLC